MIISGLWYILSAAYACICGKIAVPLQKILNLFKVMKKTLFSLALCLLGMCSAYAVSLPGTPIVFVDIYGIMPCDDGHNGNVGGSPDPNQQIVGSIDGDDLNIVIGDGNEAEAGEVIVIDPETGEVIVEEGFVGQTSVNIPEPGEYTAIVVTDNGAVGGDFVVE